jgi:hypothetical protein
MESNRLELNESILFAPHGTRIEKNETKNTDHARVIVVWVACGKLADLTTKKRAGMVYTPQAGGTHIRYEYDALRVQ